MKSWQKATLIAVIHVAIVCTLGAKLLYDRATCPRVWVKTQNYDPNLPIRGRYVALSPLFEDPNPPKIESPAEKGRQRFFPGMRYDYHAGSITVVDGKPVVTLRDDNDEEMRFSRTYDRDMKSYLTTYEPVLYFISDTVANPAMLNRGEELWVEVTIPRKGPPRPIQLALKANGVWKPLNLK
jgi:hypothetical protein